MSGSPTVGIRSKKLTPPTPPKREDSLNRNTAVLWLVVCVATAILCQFVLFREFWFSHFRLILSDTVDGSFDVAMLQHWFMAIHGKVELASPKFFFPEKNVLGYSDSFFFLAAPYVIFRCLGADRYLAMEITMMSLVTISFASLVYLFHRTLQFSRPVALFGALLFVTSNMYYIHMVHPHIVSTILLPPILLFVAKYWETKRKNPIPARIYIGISAISLAGLLLTSFYIAWFTIIFIGTVLIVYLACAVISEWDFHTIPAIGKSILLHKFDLVTGVAAFFVGITPFLLLYLPALHRTGVRPFEYTLASIPGPLAVFNVGPNNLIWGRLATRIEEIGRPDLYEHPLGWPLLTVFVFLMSALYCLITVCRRSQRSGEIRGRIRLMSAVSVTCILLWFMGVRFVGDAPVWRAVFNWVPGAQAIRVPHRINLVLNLGLVTVAMFGIQQLMDALRPHTVRAYFVVCLLGSALFAEQLNVMPTHLIDRVRELGRFARVEPPPGACSTFYIDNWSRQRPDMLQFQTDAMLVAQDFNIPTIDGYSSWFPKDWDLLSGTKSNIKEKAREWSEWHHLSSGLCTLDISSGKWAVVSLNGPRDLGDLLDSAIANRGFEQGDLFPWRTYKSVEARISRDRAHTGTFSVAENGAGAIYTDLGGLQPGVTYTVAAWFSGSPRATARPQIALVSKSSIANFSAAPSATANWQLLSYSAEIGTSGVHRIHLMRTEGQGTVYWDDVSVYRSH